MKQRILLTGADGQDLLNRITTLDFKKLEVGVQNFGLILNPQGKIRCSFFVTRTGAHAFEIIFEQPFLEILDQYTFAESYEIKPLPPVQQESDEAARIEKMIPAFGHEYLHDEQVNPLEINLRTSIHDNKGCYPGQEVIEKIISLGSPPKRLCLIEGPEPKKQPPFSLMDPENKTEAGIVTSWSEGQGLAIVKRNHLKTGTILSSYVIKRIAE